MRKVCLTPNDFEMFNLDIAPDDYGFFVRHIDTFKRMWEEQAIKYWLRFIVSFRSFSVDYGVIKDFECQWKGEQLTAIIDQAFIFLHEEFVEARFVQAKNLIMDIATIAKSQVMIPHLESKTLIKDPFYNKDTRDTYRKFFGPPTEKESYVKVHILVPLYMKFGGAICKCLRRWIAAPPMDVNDESYWTPPNTISKRQDYSFQDRLGQKCEYCGCIIEDESTGDKWDEEFVCYMKEKYAGRRCGPRFLHGWPSHEDPRFHDERNPLYNLAADPQCDWRHGMNFVRFSIFLTFVRREYACEASGSQTPSEVDQIVRHYFLAGGCEELMERRISYLKQADEHGYLGEFFDKNSPDTAAEAAAGNDDSQLAITAGPGGDTAHPQQHTCKDNKRKKKKYKNKKKAKEKKSRLAPLPRAHAIENNHMYTCKHVAADQITDAANSIYISICASKEISRKLHCATCGAIHLDDDPHMPVTRACDVCGRTHTTAHKCSLVCSSGVTEDGMSSALIQALGGSEEVAAAAAAVEAEEKQLAITMDTGTQTTNHSDVPEKSQTVKWVRTVNNDKATLELTLVQTGDKEQSTSLAYCGPAPTQDGPPLLSAAQRNQLCKQELGEDNEDGVAFFKLCSKMLFPKLNSEFLDQCFDPCHEHHGTSSIGDEEQFKQLLADLLYGDDYQLPLSELGLATRDKMKDRLRRKQIDKLIEQEKDKVINGTVFVPKDNSEAYIYILEDLKERGLDLCIDKKLLLRSMAEMYVRRKCFEEEILGMKPGKKELKKKATQHKKEITSTDQPRSVSPEGSASSKSSDSDRVSPVLPDCSTKEADQTVSVQAEVKDGVKAASDQDKTGDKVKSQAKVKVGVKLQSPLEKDTDSALVTSGQAEVNVASDPVEVKDEVKGQHKVEETLAVGFNKVPVTDADSEYGKLHQKMDRFEQEGDFGALVEVGKVLMQKKSLEEAEKETAEFEKKREQAMIDEESVQAGTEADDDADDSSSTKSSNKDNSCSRSKLRSCANCTTEEPAPKTYKKCVKCKQEKWVAAKYYCSRHCQVNDWKVRHRQEHSSADNMLD